jgi:hypothetical protein
VARQGGTYTGPRGGSATGGTAGGVYTGPRGTTVIGGARAGTVTGPGGGTASGGKGGAVVIGPEGNVHASGGKAGTVTGPGGGTAAGVARGSATAGPGGAAASGGRVGTATGPGGTTVTGGERGAAVAGPGGAVAAGGRAVAASGPYGAVATGGRGVAAVGPGGAAAYGTRYVGASNLQGQAVAVRRGYVSSGAFRPGWYARYPGAWAAAGFVAGSAWTAATWGSCASTVGYPAETTAYAYDYGSNITIQEGQVYYDDQVYATEAQYAEQATAIADAGQQAQPAESEQWQPLGIFAMVKGDATESNDIFQLALSKNGVVRGNYYNATTDTVTPVKGSLDKKTQRIAWIVGENKNTVFEAGLLNLTREQTTALVHQGKDKTQQVTLVRLEEPAPEKKE